MNTRFAILLALPLLVAPAWGQDLLGPLQDFVDELTEQPAPQRPRAQAPVAPSVTPAVPPPVPRPRPPDLPDLPDGATPTEEEAPGPVEQDAPDVDEPAPDAEPEPAAELEPEVLPEAEPEPTPEPDRIYQAACPAVVMGLVEAEMAPPISEGKCGERSPLVVTAVLSRGRMVPLSASVTTNCQMASALPDWVADVDGYAETMLESRLAQVDTGTGYMCRGRNNQESGFTSEHGFANAVDVVGFTLEDGRTVSVTADWLPAAEPAGRLLRLAHDAACGGFMTVLGPEANAEHEDHLHLDMGCHGERCVARVCE